MIPEDDLARSQSEFDVFLCHNSDDKPVVEQLARELREAGLRPWFDLWEIRPGTKWQRELERQIKSIRAVAICVGDHSLGPWQREEVEGFLREFVDRQVPVIPVVLKTAKSAPKLPLFLSGFHWVDFRIDHPDPLVQMVWAITGNRPPTQSGEIEMVRHGCAETGTATLRGHRDRISDLEWSPDGRFLASASRDSTVRIWDVDYAKPRSVLRSHQSDVGSVSWFQDGRLVSGSRDQTVRVWDDRSNEVRRVNFRSPIEHVACAPRGAELAVVCRDNSVHICDIDSTEKKTKLDHDDRVHSINWASNGLTIATTCGNTVHLWSTEQWEVIQRIDFDAVVRDAVFLERDTKLVIGGDRPSLAIYETSTATPLLEIDDSVCASHLCAAAEHGLLAAQSGKTGETFLWETDQWHRVGSLRTSKYRRRLTPVSFDPLKCRLATTPRSDSATIRLSLV